MPTLSSKAEFKAILNKVEREGVETVLQFLEDTDFYTAPASTKYHGACPKGLLLHSLNVYHILTKLAEDLAPVAIPQESIIICGLLHDVCKISFYQLNDEPATPAQIKKFESLSDLKLPKEQITKKYLSILIDYFVNGCKGTLPKYTPNYSVNDIFPVGHGEKSVILLQPMMALTSDEVLAIRWHLGGFDPGVNFGYPSGLACHQALKSIPLVGLLMAADLLATWIVEDNE